MADSVVFADFKEEIHWRNDRFWQGNATESDDRNYICNFVRQIDCEHENNGCAVLFGRYGRMFVKLCKFVTRLILATVHLDT